MQATFVRSAVFLPATSRFLNCPTDSILERVLHYNHRLSSMSLLANGEFTRILCIGPVQVRIRRATTTWLLSGAFSRRLFAGSAAARR